MQIHPVQTGTLRLKRRYVAARWRNRLLRSLDIVADRRWTAPLPVYAWVVDHPNGPLVVDAGATVACYDRKRLSLRSKLFDGRSVWFDVAPEESLSAQLDSLGVDPMDVRWVVQTHLAPDHTAGVSAFRNAEVVVARREWEAASAWSLAPRWPGWVERSLVDYDGSLGPFPESHVLTEGVALVSTPGHTAGHQSVICYDDDCTLFFAGDATFSQSQLLNGTVAGIVDDYDEAETTIERIRAFVEMTPTVYLPSHDPESPRRLRRRETVPLSPSYSPDASTESLHP